MAGFENFLVMITQNIAIVQARMGSARFPGKMLAHLGGVPLIEWVLRRLSLAKTLSQIILATTDDEVDDVLVELATGLGCSVFRGSGGSSHHGRHSCCQWN